MKTTQEINRSNLNRLSDQFYVSYMKLPENVSNLLGKQTKRIERPTFRFEYSQINKRRNQVNNMMQLRFESIEVAFFDDENALTSQALYIQMFRQINQGKDLYGNWGNYNERDYKFDVKMELMNSQGHVVEGYILKNCYISNIRHTELSTPEDDVQTEITLMLTFDNVEIWIVDEYVAAINQSTEV